MSTTKTVWNGSLILKIKMGDMSRDAQITTNVAPPKSLIESQTEQNVTEKPLIEEQIEQNVSEKPLIEAQTEPILLPEVSINTLLAPIIDPFEEFISYKNELLSLLENKYNDSVNRIKKAVVLAKEEINKKYESFVTQIDKSVSSDVLEIIKKTGKINKKEANQKISTKKKQTKKQAQKETINSPKVVPKEINENASKVVSNKTSKKMSKKALKKASKKALKKELQELPKEEIKQELQELPKEEIKQEIINELSKSVDVPKVSLVVTHEHISQGCRVVIDLIKTNLIDPAYVARNYKGASKYKGSIKKLRTSSDKVFYAIFLIKQAFISAIKKKRQARRNAAFARLREMSRSDVVAMLRNKGMSVDNFYAHFARVKMNKMIEKIKNTSDIITRIHVGFMSCGIFVRAITNYNIKLSMLLTLIEILANNKIVVKKNKEAYAIYKHLSIITERLLVDNTPKDLMNVSSSKDALGFRELYDLFYEYISAMNANKAHDAYLTRIIKEYTTDKTLASTFVSFYDHLEEIVREIATVLVSQQIFTHNRLLLSDIDPISKIIFKMCGMNDVDFKESSYKKYLQRLGRELNIDRPLCENIAQKIIKLRQYDISKTLFGGGHAAPQTPPAFPGLRREHVYYVSVSK